MFYNVNDSRKAGPMNSPYKRVVPLPQNIRKHCWIYFDEQLYSSALTILSDVLSASVVASDDHDSPVFAPPAIYIELISCLLIHPRHTSQVSEDDGSEFPSRAISFLRTLLCALGPVNANLCDAFSFPDVASGRSARRNGEYADVNDGSTNSEDEEIVESLRGLIANSGRLRKCARDFWHVLGWAFNCSVSHPERWKCWKIWLDYMLDVLSADLDERERLDALQVKAKDNAEHCGKINYLEGALLVQYLWDAKGRSSAMKRVVRSVLADGGAESSKEFPEVFPNEIRQGGARKRQKRKGRVSLLDGYDDYDEDGDVDTESGSPGASSIRVDERKRNFSHSKVDEVQSTTSAWLGGPESINMRQRLLGLLSRVTALLPDSFVKCADLYDEICTCTRTLPLPAFSMLISPSNSSHFPVVALVSFTQLLLCRLLPNHAPRPESISHRAGDYVTQATLEKCLLPFSANTSSIADNAKVSILVESVLRLFMRSCNIYPSPTLNAAVETGILARKSKTKSDRRRRENASKKMKDDDDTVWLDNSAERLRALLLWIEESSSNG